MTEIQNDSKRTESNLRLLNSFRITHRNVIRIGYAVFRDCFKNKAHSTAAQYAAAVGLRGKESCSALWHGRLCGGFQKLDDTTGFSQVHGPVLACPVSVATIQNSRLHHHVRCGASLFAVVASRAP